MKIIYPTSKKLQKLFERKFINRRLQEKVKKIVEDVRLFGDEALIKYTKKFDRVKLSLKQLRVSDIEISAAYQSSSSNFVKHLKIVIDNISRFYRKQLKKSWRIKADDGIWIAEKYQSLERIGIYIPAGSAPLISTVYMTVIPAKIAGVKEIVIVSPPNIKGEIDPYILMVADLLKVNEIYRIGGAQAIAALAFGTKTIRKVDKIFGPGNIYVTEAKRQVFGYVDVDMLAGPTELVIIANRFSNTDFIVADLKAQAEHKEGLCILITNSRKKALEVKAKMEGYSGYIVLTKNIEQAIEIANRLSPEHLELLIKNPLRWFKKITNSSAVFLGQFSPVAVGDYIAGPSHVLPTYGTAKFFSGINLVDFMKSIHVINYSKKGLEKVVDTVEKIASLEGMQQHLNSIKIRIT
ncbi:MAG: histidinol dehydrogenase [Candidatus Omnitrophica bacterium]|nr:histidinol dehydrogenase [Candidatus Omnitrophota bacterium]MCM8800074.1 histidinol dehydrogenase [Candidatus Omnitrophota bacterium]